MLIALLLVLGLTVALAPETPVARALHRWLVVLPARWLSRISRGHVLLAGAALAGIVFAVWLMRGDAVVMAFGAPEILAFAATFDLASVLDLALVAVLAASSVRWRAIASRLRRTKTKRTAPRRRAPHAPRPRRPANDEEPRPALAA